MAQGPVIAVTGLRREARILAGPGVVTLAGGGDHARLEAAIEAACAVASGIICIGLGGALAQGLAPGDWVVASEIIPLPLRSASDPDLPPQGEVRPKGEKGARRAQAGALQPPSPASPVLPPVGGDLGR